jgi:hypothetical protein
MAPEGAGRFEFARSAKLVAGAGFALNLRSEKRHRQMLALLAAGNRSGLFRAVA